MNKSEMNVLLAELRPYLAIEVPINIVKGKIEEGKRLADPSDPNLQLGKALLNVETLQDRRRRDEIFEGLVSANISAVSLTTSRELVQALSLLAEAASEGDSQELAATMEVLEEMRFYLRKAVAEKFLRDSPDERKLALQLMLDSLIVEHSEDSDDLDLPNTVVECVEGILHDLEAEADSKDISNN